MNGSFVTCSCLGTTGEFGGEFGNQLFQIAAVLGQAHRHGRRALFRPWKCRHGGRDYARYFGPLEYRERIASRHVYRQRRFAFDEIPDRPALDLLGSFQSERYFFEIRDRVRHLFREPDEISSAVTAYLQANRLFEYAAFHLRFYDRESRDRTPLIHTLPEHYFIEAAKHLGKERPIVLVTNNPTRAKIFAQRHLRGRDVVVASNHEALVDFYLITRAKAVVISNSTFGWWSAYLNPHVKTVFAPDRKKWFAFPNRLEPAWSTPDLYPSHFVEVAF